MHFRYIKVRKKNRLWYLSTSSRPSASLPLSVNKLEKKSSVDAIFMPKTALFKINPIEDTYKLSKLQIEKREVIVKNQQYQLQLSYYKKHENFDNFTQTE